VCAIGLGTLACGVAYPDPSARPDAATFAAIVKAAAARCGPAAPLFVDAADTYCHPHTAKHAIEAQLRDVAATLPAGSPIIVSTKSGMVRIKDDSTGWRPGSTRPEAVRAAILAAQAAVCGGGSAGGAADGAAAAAGADGAAAGASGPQPLFLWSLHHADGFAAPGVLEAAMAAALQCVAEGRLLHIGLCNATVPLIARARSVAPIAAVQNEWGLFQREADRLRPPGAAASSRKGVLRYCAESGITFVAHSPLGGLKARRGERGAAGLPALAALAAARGVSPHAAGLACLLHRGQELGARVLLIPGARTAAHAVDSVAAAGLALTDAEVRAVLGPPE